MNYVYIYIIYYFKELLYNKYFILIPVFHREVGWVNLYNSLRECGNGHDTMSLRGLF